MNQYSRSPQSFQQQNISQHLQRPLGISQFRNIGLQKMDQASVMQSYRKMRLDQQEKLAQLNMSKQMKKKLFGLDVHEQMRVRNQNLVIFNHPFKGKIIMTKQKAQQTIREQKQKQIQRQSYKGKQGQSQNYYNQKTDHQQGSFANNFKKQKIQDQSKSASLNLQNSEKNIQVPLKRKEHHKANKNNQQEQQQNFKKTDSFIQNYKTETNIIQKNQITHNQKVKSNITNHNYPIIGQEPVIVKELGLHTTGDEKQKKKEDKQFKISLQKVTVNNQQQKKFNFKKQENVKQTQSIMASEFQKNKTIKDKKKGINTTKKIMKNNQNKLSQSEQQLNFKEGINSISQISSIQSKGNRESDSQKSLNRNLFQ